MYVFSDNKEALLLKLFISFFPILIVFYININPNICTTAQQTAVCETRGHTPVMPARTGRTAEFHPPFLFIV